MVPFGLVHITFEKTEQKKLKTMSRQAMNVGDELERVAQTVGSKKRVFYKGKDVTLNSLLQEGIPLDKAQLIMKSHVVCFNGRECYKKGCSYEHPEGREIDEKKEVKMCQFGRKCHKKECWFKHPEGREIDEKKEKKEVRECQFGMNCHKKGCWFRHPEGREVDEKKEKKEVAVCKFGTGCKRPGCWFRHPEGMEIDE